MASSKLRIAGAWAGPLEVDLDSWTLSMLRGEVFRRSAAGDGFTVSLICGGRILKEHDDGLPLAQLGLKNNSKVLVTIVSAEKGKSVDEELASEERRSSELVRLKAAALALTERHAVFGSLPLEDFNMELEDQSGQNLKLVSQTDRKGAMMGVMLHTNGKHLIEKEKYKDALDVLLMAEEAFSLCDPKLIEMIDNFPILQLDIVWCYFMLRDVSCLSVAGIRLAKARKGFERSHGKDAARLRALEEGRYLELAIYLRLELLEGVAAYYSGKPEESRKALISAQYKFNQLEVSDEALSQMMSMGYEEKPAKTALRMTGQDIGGAVEFLVEERSRKMRRVEENRQRQEEILEQQSYGPTPMNKAVNIKRLNQLVSIGYERALAAEALRINENDTQLALDLLTDPDKNCHLQSRVELRKLARNRTAVGRNTSARQGSSSAEAATHGTAAEAPVIPSTAAAAEAQGSSSTVTADQVAAEAERRAAAGSARSRQRDVEMEDELIKKLSGDPIADYDINVSKEGEAIAEYLSLLDTPVQDSNGSSLQS